MTDRYSTSATLLRRVADLKDEEAWGRLVNLYTPFLFVWGQRMGLRNADASDLVQEVLIVMAKKLPTFKYDKSKSFRGWLKTIATNRAKNFLRDAAARPVVGVNSAIAKEASSDPGTDLFDELEHRSFVAKQLLELVRGEFREIDWEAFRLVIFEECSPTEVARKLNMSVNSVYLAKSRVLRRLREEANDLID